MVIYLEKGNIKLSFFSVCYLFVSFRGVRVDVKNLNAEKCFLIIAKLKLVSGLDREKFKILLHSKPHI